MTDRGVKANAGADGKSVFPVWGRYGSYIQRTDNRGMQDMLQSFHRVCRDAGTPGEVISGSRRYIPHCDAAGKAKAIEHLIERPVAGGSSVKKYLFYFKKRG